MSTPIAKTVSYSGEALAKMKEESLVPKEVLASLKAQAEALLEAEPLSVINRKCHAPTGNLREYASIGPYWWPNPETADGLPYIRRDGEHNPQCKEPQNYEFMAKRVHLLALAAYYFDDARYAKCAVRQLKAWHTDAQTGMIPHAQYAQGIPGICQGRGIGLIEFSLSFETFNAIAILEALGQIEPDFMESLKEWYNTFLDFMLTSENGLAEEVHPNNHGTWYDVQVLAAARFTGRPNLANRVIKLAYDRRVRAHIRPDGSQPEELARTRAINYSLYNLYALTQIGNMAQALGDDRYWADDAEQGDCLLLRAFDFIAPHAKAPESTPYQEIDPKAVSGLFAQLTMRMEARFPGRGYAELAAPFLSADALWRAYPQF